jgi:hypothetical protein
MKIYNKTFSCCKQYHESLRFAITARKLIHRINIRLKPTVMSHRVTKNTHLRYVYTKFPQELRIVTEVPFYNNIVLLPCIKLIEPKTSYLQTRHYVHLLRLSFSLYL